MGWCVCVCIVSQTTYLGVNINDSINLYKRCIINNLLNKSKQQRRGSSSSGWPNIFLDSFILLSALFLQSLFFHNATLRIENVSSMNYFAKE